MHGHLVAVEVRIKGGAHQRVQGNRVSFDLHGLERLDGEAVERRGAVEEYELLVHDLLQEVPENRVWLARALDHAFGRPSIGRVITLEEFADEEWLKQFQAHLRRQTALVEQKLRVAHDHGAPRIIHALAQQMLAQVAPLATDRVGQAFERLPTRPGEGTISVAVVKERVTRFLQEALLVVEHHLGCLQRRKTLHPVVAVNHALIEDIQIAGSESSAVKGYQRS